MRWGGPVEKNGMVSLRFHNHRGQVEFCRHTFELVRMGVRGATRGLLRKHDVTRGSNSISPTRIVIRVTWTDGDRAYQRGGRGHWLSRHPHVHYTSMLVDGVMQRRSSWLRPTTPHTPAHPAPFRAVVWGVKGRGERKMCMSVTHRWWECSGGEKEGRECAACGATKRKSRP